MKKGIVAAALAVTLAAFGLACSETGGLDFDPPDRCDYLVLVGVTTGGDAPPTNTEVDCPIDFVIGVTVDVSFLQVVGGAGGTIPGTTNSTFLIDKYIVSYRNITQNGANIPRTHVPETILNTVAVQLTGGEGTLSFFPTLLEAAARSQPPLNSDSFFTIGTDPLAGVVLEAEMVVWGHPVLQPSRECRGTMVYRFTVYDVPSSTPGEIAFQDAICAAEIGG